MVKVDENNNIIEIIPEVEIVNYEYDVLNRRIEKKTPDKTITYIYAGQNAIEEIVTDKVTQTTTIRENIYSNNLDDILFTVVTNPDQTIKYQYYTKNHLGSTTAITDETGKVLETYIYDIFGKPYIKDGNSTNHREFKQSARGITRLYTGREYDSETNLYYMRARYYSPITGRFISRDPIDITDDVNLYSYVGNNGVMFTDLMGLEGKPLIKQSSLSDATSYKIIYSPKEAVEIGMTEMSKSKSIYHSYNLPFFDFNRKFVSEDGHNELVFDYKTGEIVTDPINVGTYNKYNPNEDKVSHIVIDTFGYIINGTSEMDTTNIFERTVQIYKIVPGYIIDIGEDIKGYLIGTQLALY